MTHELLFDVIETETLPPIYHLGPPLSTKEFASVFYLALSGKDSLTLDPYNQPAILLAKRGVRVFSLTLPDHEGLHPYQGAMMAWHHRLANGGDFCRQFATVCHQVLDFLIKKHYVSSRHIGITGLSRGAFLAAHVAANDARISSFLGFAPLTRLDHLDELQSSVKDELKIKFSLQSLIHPLSHKRIRWYIGNHDTRVHTADCFAFIEALSKEAYAQKIRSAPIELIIYPSIGHKGHGTPPHIFQAGSDWLINALTDA